MSDANMLFLTASRSKFRFGSVAGLLTTEDLWDLPLTGKGANLDDIARGLHKSLKDADGDVSFVKPTVKSTADIQMKFDIVKHVIDVKVSERDERKAAEEKAATKQRIMAKIAEKKDKALDDLSTDQLEAMLNTL
jgi:hypothetical protein